MPLHPARRAFLLRGSLGKTHVDQGATTAVSAGLRRRRLPVAIQAMHCGCEFFSARAKLRRKDDLLTPARIAVEDRATRNGGLQHLLQAKRLRAELDGVAIGWLALAPLVFHRVRLRTELDDVGASGQVESLRPQPHTAHRAEVCAPALTGQIGALMQQPPFGSPSVLHPDLFQVDQRPLSRIEGQVLQTAKRQRVVVFRNGIS